MSSSPGLPLWQRGGKESKRIQPQRGCVIRNEIPDKYATPERLKQRAQSGNPGLEDGAPLGQP